MIGWDLCDHLMRKSVLTLTLNRMDSIYYEKKSVKGIVWIHLLSQNNLILLTKESVRPAFRRVFGHMENVVGSY